jgi:hypothetical protein
MTSQMKRALTRVDGVTSTIAPIHVFGPDSTREPETPRRARKGARARVLNGRLPRALEVLLLASEPSDPLIHQDLAAAGLL